MTRAVNFLPWPGIVICIFCLCCIKNYDKNKFLPHDSNPSESVAADDSSSSDDSTSDDSDIPTDSDSSSHSDSLFDSDTGTACPHDTGVPGKAELYIEDIGLKLVGEEAGDAAGYMSVAAGGDGDGDGQPDLLVGMPGNDRTGPNSGATYLIRGPLSRTMDLSEAEATMLGPVSQATGYGVAFAGDINADGYDDILVGAPGVYPDDEGSGQAYLVFGPVLGETSLGDADAVLLGEWEDVLTYDRDFSYTGAAVARAGDMNGDGYGDLLVGAYGYRGWQGAAYAVLGPISGTYNLEMSDLRVTELTGGYLGMQVSSIGDTNGDGLDDVAFTGTRATVIFYGPPGGDLLATDADSTLRDLGSATTSADADGDGYTDVLASDGYSNEGAQGGGAVYLFHGPLRGTLTDQRADARILGAVEWGTVWGNAIVDVNGDGQGDAVVAEPGGREPPGGAYVVFGPLCGTSSLADADVVLHGQGDDWITFAVAAADIDLDGLDDILLSGQGDDDGGEDAGAAWLVLGSSMR